MTVTEWGAIKVPKRLLQVIDNLKHLEGVPRHVIVAKAIQLYMAQLEDVGGRGHCKGRKHPRKIWYAWKFMLSYAEFRVAVKYKRYLPKKVREELLKYLEYNLFVLRDRIKVITPQEAKELYLMLREYAENPSNELLYKLNDMVRDVWMRILF
ncbi:MAG: hypothetical protein DRP11_01395 [Candidatus Aenigmatarchaeota archaeon]|nr:MAG: hypothetical protein DRP11_01395 [Candidatus Aenigmarchaeota archaeon]